MSRRHILPIALVLIVLTGVLSVLLNPANAQDFGTSPWSSQFYNSTNLTNPIAGATPVYSRLNFTWSTVPTTDTGAAVAGVPADNYSVVFTSTQVLAAGTYTFTVNADDRATLQINGQPVVTTTTPGVAQSAQAVLPGGAVTMRVEFIEQSGTAYLQVFWGLAGGGPGPGATAGPTPLPTETPLPTQTPLPEIPSGALTATVIRARVLNVRDAPSLGANKIGETLRGQTYAVVGRNAEATWFLLQLSGYQGWAYGYYLYTNRNEFQAPILSANAVYGLEGLPDTGVQIQVLAGLRLRAAPSVASEQTGRITWGALLPVVGRTADGFWYQVIWRGSVGWLYSPFVDIIQGNLNNVPIR